MPTEPSATSPVPPCRHLAGVLVGGLAAGLGAILFPIGHAVGAVPALVGGDLVLVAAFFMLVRDRGWWDT